MPEPRNLHQQAWSECSRARLAGCRETWGRGFEAAARFAATRSPTGDSTRDSSGSQIGGARSPSEGMGWPRLTIDPLLAGAAFGIGIVVGLTGMGGGALMTPILVMFFNVPPLTAVSSDLMASAVMKPVGSFVH